MHRRQTIMGALSAFAASVAGIGSAQAKFTTSDVERICAAIRGIGSFEDFWADPDAMEAYNTVDNPCHDVAYDQYLRLHYKSPPYSHS